MSMSSVKKDHISGPQLRGSCNACNIAKVKCSKKQPRCRRCDSRNECCTYGVSMRSVSKKHHYSETSRLGHAVDLTKRCIVDGKLVEGNPTPIPGQQSTITPPMSDGGDMDWFDPSFNGAWVNGFQDVINDGLHLFPQPAVDFDAMRYSSMPTSDVSMGFAQPQAPSELHAQTNLMTPKPSNHTVDASGQLASCSCHQTVLSLLMELSATNTTSFEPDQGLAVNKVILTVCTTILQCCSEGTHRHDSSILLHLTSILSHGVGIFDALAQARAERKAQSNRDYFASASYKSSHACVPPSSESKPWDKQISADQSGSVTWPNASGRRRSIRLILGSYQLDREDEDVLQGNLINIELRKIERVLEALGRCFADDEAELAEFALAYLQRRLQSHRQCI